MSIDGFHFGWGLVIAGFGAVWFYATYARWKYWVDPPPTFYWGPSFIRDVLGKKGVIVYGYVLSIAFMAFGLGMIWQSLR